MKKKNCPHCGETGSYVNRAFKKAGKRRCKNGKCRVMFFKEEAEKAEEIEEGLNKFRETVEDLEDEISEDKLEEIKEKIK